MQRLEAGMIKDRKDVIAALGYAGFEINRQGKEYLSIKDRETGLKIRLKGMIYEERFTAAAAERRAEARVENRERTEEDREVDRGKSRRGREEFERQLERITRYNENRYRVKVQSAQEHCTQSRVSAGSDHGSDNHSRDLDLGRMDFGHLPSRSEDCASSLGADREECRTDKRASGWDNQTLSKRPGLVGAKDTGRNEVGNDHERSVRRDHYPDPSTIEGAGYDRNRGTIERVAEAITESSRAIIAGTAGLAAAAKERYGAFKNTVGKLRMKMDEELENFKKLDLREYLKANGYALDLKKTTTSSAVMKKDLEKIVVGRAENGHYQYFSLSDPDDNGTVIDFIQRKTGGNPGDIRKTLRYWKPEAVIGIPMVAFDKTKIQTALQLESFPLYTGEYLARRGIRKKTLELFDVRQNASGSAVFLHQDLDGVCGAEVMGENLEDFTGGTKGLSIATGTESLRDVAQVVVCESMIDAMSYYQLHHDDFEKVVYVSIGGSLSDQQIELLKKLIDGTNGTVKLALDKDESGEKISNEIIEKVFRKEAVQIVTSKSKDWNQDLKESLKSLQKIMGV
ncbi:MAG: toprim domain-containing protein [Leptospirillum sp.]